MQRIKRPENAKFLIISAFILTFFSIISCGSTPKNEKNIIPEPEWIANKKSVYPDSEYLAQLGTGLSARESQNNAIAELAAYFNTNVKSLVQNESFIYNGKDNQSWTERSVQYSIVTTTDLELFALETTDPYYLDRENKWYCCAYINRKTAWNQYEPLVRDKKNEFYSFYSLAEGYTDPLDKIKAYSNTQAPAQAFIASLFRASMFSKPLTDQAFGKDRALAASLPGLIQKEKDRCLLYVNCTGDFGNIVSSAVNSIFSDMGFKLSDSKERSIYIVETAINYNAIEQDDLLVYYPSVKLSVNSTEKSLYVYENKLDRILSYNESKAKNTACNKVSELLQKELAADFKAAIGLVE